MVKYTNDQLLESLRECYNKHGEITNQILNKDDELPSGPTYSYRFDSLHKAAERAGLDEAASNVKKNEKIRNGYTKNEIVSHIKKISTDGRVTPTMIRSSDGPSPTATKNCFDVRSIFNIDVDGVDIVSSLEKPSKNELKEVVKSIDKKNEYVTRDDIRQECKISYVKEYYGSVSNMFDELGVTTYVDYRNSSNIFNGEMYLYCTELSNSYYVGISSQPKKRIRQHCSNLNDFIKVERIIDISGCEDYSDKEREMAMEIAREYETTDVYGGK